METPVLKSTPTAWVANQAISVADRSVFTFWVKISTKLLKRLRLDQERTFFAMAVSIFC